MTKWSSNADDSIVDLTEPDSEVKPRTVNGLLTSRDLYARWDRQQWSVAGVDSARDRSIWSEMSQFMRDELLDLLAEVEVGEVSVSQTLGALLFQAPSEDDRIFISTQIADEARHVRFLEAYLDVACGVLAQGHDLREKEASADYTKYMAPVLEEVTRKARDGSREEWYRAVVYYHLVVEGVIAATALRSARQLAGRLGLGALREGLANVIRDESRHVSFGLRTVAIGVESGRASAISGAYLEAIRLAAMVLVGTTRRRIAPKTGQILAIRAKQLQGVLDIAEDRVVRQLRLIGLGADVDRGIDTWRASIEEAFDAYEQVWAVPHPIRAAKLSLPKP